MTEHQEDAGAGIGFGGTDTNDYLSFKIESETYGIDILSVQEIIGYTETTKIPNAPDYIRGVINLRGNVLPIVDLRKKFGLEEIPLDKFNVIIIVKTRGKIMGMLVDSVSDVLSLRTDQLQDVPDFSSRIETRFIRNMGKLEGKLVILLDLDTVMNIQEIHDIMDLSPEQVTA